MHTFQAVLLIGGTSPNLHPLTATGTPKALLPVANEPLVSFPLKALEDSGVEDVIAVCAGDTVAAKVSSWVAKKCSAKLQVKVKAIPEDKGSVEALRQTLDLTAADSIVIISGDTVTDCNLRVLLATHYHNAATVTILLTQRTSSPSADTKPGKAPKAVDYIGLDPGRRRILFLDSSREDKREVKVPLKVLQACQRMDLCTHLADQHLYVIDRQAALSVLQSKPNLSSIQRDLIPYLVSHQQDPQPGPLAALLPRDSSEGLDASASPGPGREPSPPAAASGTSVSASFLAELSHTPQPNRGQAWLCQAYVAPQERLCIRASTLASYGDANREVTTPDRATRLLGRTPDERTGAVMAEGVTLGHKAVVGGGSLVGARTRLGDRSSVKRSVLGQGCSLGANVKVDKCVIMDGATVGDGAQLHSCIVCTSAHVQDRCILRDCQVGAEFIVPEGTDSRGETFAKSKRPDLGRISSAGQ